MLWVQANLYLTSKQAEAFATFAEAMPRAILRRMEQATGTGAPEASVELIGLGPQEQANLAWSLTVLDDHTSGEADAVLGSIFRAASSHYTSGTCIRLENAHQLWQALYLLEDGREMYLWVGRATSREALRETFGVEHVDALGTASHSVVPRLDTNANKSLNAFIDALRRMRSSYMRLRVLRRGDARENAYYRRLIEDRSPAGQSYVEFLCHVHRLIQNKFQ